MRIESIRAGLLVVLLGLPTATLAQPENADGSREFDSGRMTIADATTVGFDSGRLDATTLSYDPGDGDGSRTIDLEKVLRVEVVTGHDGPKYALVGGISGALGAWLGSATSPSDVEVSDSTKTTIVVVLGGVSMIAGYFIGSSHKTYETVYENPMFEGLRDAQSAASCSPANTVFQIGMRF